MRDLKCSQSQENCQLEQQQNCQLNHNDSPFHIICLYAMELEDLVMPQAHLPLISLDAFLPSSIQQQQQQCNNAEKASAPNQRPRRHNKCRIKILAL